MIVDPSAIVAVIKDEADAGMFDAAVVAATRPRLSAAGYVETAVVIDGARDPVASRELDRWIETVGLEVVSLTPQQARIARQAYRDFGRGSGHPATLNLGDCFSYALAVDTGEPLLYKGDGFVHTDVTPALPR